jgi:two-component system, NarL family, response regulator NreC
MNKATFIIAAEGYIVRKGISAILKNIAGVEILKETDRSDVLKNLLMERVPDFLVVSGEMLRKIRHETLVVKNLGGRVIVVGESSIEGSEGLLVQLIPMDTPKDKIIKMVETLVAPYILSKSAREERVLSDREVTILSYIARGFTNKEIAEKLFLSLHTVNTHRKNICNKLGIKSVSGLTVYAIVNNVISIEDIRE